MRIAHTGRVLLGCLSLASIRLPAQASWFPLRNMHARAAFATTYDAARHRIVVHGGIDTWHVKLGDTWESDGTAWFPRMPATVAPARGAHACEYDPVRREVIMFGGEAATGQAKLADTWRWDGADWRQLAPASSPPARDYHALAYDAARSRIVLFGGRDPLTNALADTWEWDGTNWMQRTPATVPTARYAHALAYDSGRGRVVMFGGVAATLLGDTWEWDGSNWTQRPTPVAPAARCGHCMTHDATTGRTVLLGGITSVTPPIFSTETWEWDGASWSMAAAGPAPPMRLRASSIYDAVQSAVVLVPGDGPTWRWNGTTWTQLGQATPPAPPELSVFGLAHDTWRGVVVAVVYTGVIDTWEWDGWQWLRRAVGTPTQLYPGVTTMAFDSTRGRTVVFLSPGATWEYDGNLWVGGPTSPSPTSRRNPAMAYDPARGTCVLFGGSSISSSGPLADTWEWNGVGWTLRNPTTSPPARTLHAMAFDSTRGRMVMFGGAGVGLLGDTWEWDGTSWMQRNPAVSPPARQSHGLVYDKRRARTVLYGGQNGSTSYFLDTWEWDGTAWAQGPAGSEGAGPMQVSDPLGRVMALTTARRIWFYAATPAAALVTSGTACAGSNGPPLLTAGTPFVGNAAFTLDLLSARPASTCAFGLAAAPAVIPLPGGCTLHVGSPIVALPATSNANGFASLPLPLPRDPAIHGVPVYAQGFVLDPAGPFAGVAMTAGLAVTLGH